jgi:hypothetical protein
MRRLFQGGLKTALYIALVLAASIGLDAKGTTVKLTLTGPGLARPVEIVDPVVLGWSNVWEGGFLGDTLAAAPRVKVPT